MLTVSEVCHVTGLSRKTIYRKMASNELPYQQNKGRRLVKESDAKRLISSVTNDTHNESSDVSEIVSMLTHLTQEVAKLRAEVKKLSEPKVSHDTPVTQKQKKINPAPNPDAPKKIDWDVIEKMNATYQEGMDRVQLAEKAGISRNGKTFKYHWLVLTKGATPLA